MFKKICCFMLCFSIFLLDIKAHTFKGGEVIDNVFVKKVSKNNEVEFKKGQFIVDENNEYVYCLEPFVKVKKDMPYEIYETDFTKVLNISEETWQKMNLIVQYGYEYKDNNYDHTDKKWYYITQMMLWEVADIEGKFYFTDTFKGQVNEDLFKSEKEEINYLVSRHFVTPEFDFSQIFLGDTVILEDKNGVLANFLVDNPNIIKENNQLKLNVTNLKTSFNLTRQQTNVKPIIYVSNDSQNIIKGYMNVNVFKNYEFEALIPKGNIRLKKYGEAKLDKILLQDIEFTLYDENMTILSTKKTDKNGELVFEDLPKGTYFLKETNTNPLYELDDTLYEIKLEVDSNNRVIDIYKELENKLKKGKINLKKYGETGKEKIELKDIEFTLYDEDMKVLSVKYTDARGNLEFANLPLGTYFLKETKGNSLHELDNNLYEIKLELGENNKVINVYKVLENKLKKGSIKLKKYGEVVKIEDNALAYEHDCLENIEFTLYDENMQVLNIKQTDINGELIFADLPVGTYYIKETGSNPLYEVDDVLYKVILELDQEKKVINVNKTMVNKLKKGKIIIYKKDLMTKEAIQNTKFHLYYKDTLIFAGFTNEDGILEIDNLPYGKYTLKEAEASKDYILDDNNREIELCSEEESIDIFNIPDTFVNIKVVFNIESKDDFVNDFCTS